MILETLVSWACTLLKGLISAVNVFSLPTDLIKTLGTITGYGSWVVGGDLLLIVVGCVGFWWGIKITVGLGLFIYHQIPLNG